MQLITRDPIEAYLAPSMFIDVCHPAIQAHVKMDHAISRSDVEAAKVAFEFVRDDIAHSWDIQSRRVTIKASEVFEHREGICYGKSHLLAALLRCMGIPAGICYQKLTLGDTPDTGYCIHALNTVYLRSLDRWIRLDARGNKPGVDAQFSVSDERLAFPVREDFGEQDYWNNYALPHPKIVETLMAHDDCLLMYSQGLPTEL